MRFFDTTAGRVQMAACVVLALIGPAHAGNQDSVFLGNVAATTAGAVTARIRDGEAAWYNPAGLGGSALNSIDASASAFVLRLRNIAKLAETILPDGSSLAVDVRSTEILSIPSALVYTRALSPDVWLSLSVFVPEQDTVSLSDTKDQSVGLQDGTQLDYRQHISMRLEQTAYFVGPSVGWQVTDRVRIGGSLFVVYATSRQELQAWTEVAATAAQVDAAAYSLFDERSTRAEVGLQAVFGTQVELGAGWMVGATLRSPVFRIAEWGELTSLEHYADAGIPGTLGTTEATYDTASLDATGFGVAVPARLHAGVAYDFGEGWVAVDADVSHPLAADAGRGVDARQWTWNARVGARVQLSPSFTLGAGFFTDNSPYERPSTSDIGAEYVNYYGGTLGLEYRKRYAVTGEERGDALTFSSTFAFRYAAGVGTAIGSTTHLLEETAEPPPGRSIDLLYHEVALHIGSALYF